MKKKLTNCIHCADQKLLVIQARKVLDLFLRKELTKIVNLDAQTTNNFLNLKYNI